jgi:hypothetical protein
VPEATLHWTVSPFVEVGRVLPDDLGLFALGYRFLTSTGSSTVIGPDGGTANVHSQIDFNVLDFDYGIPTIHFAPHWDYSWRLGFRLAQAYFDSTLTEPSLSLRATDWFLGGGIHARFDLRREYCFLPGLSSFIRLEGSALIGQIHQHFYETLNNPDGTSTSATTYLHGTQTVPIFSFQAGLSYSPPSWQHFQLSVGFQAEEWYHLGRFSGTDSRGDFYSNGVFLRAGFDY